MWQTVATRRKVTGLGTEGGGVQQVHTLGVTDAASTAAEDTPKQFEQKQMIQVLDAAVLKTRPCEIRNWLRAASRMASCKDGSQDAGGGNGIRRAGGQD